MKFWYLLLLLIVISCIDNKKSPEASIDTDSPDGGTPVITTIVSKDHFQKQLIANGVIRAKRKAELRFKTTETIEQIFYANGSRIQKGDLIATLNNRILKTNLEKAKIEFINAQNRMTVEKINFGLNHENNEDIDEKILRTLHRNSKYPEAKNELEKAKILYEQSRLIAPFEGTLANITAQTGNIINTTEVFCVIYSHHLLDVVFYVLESDLKSIEIGQIIKVLPITDEKLNTTGKIIEINPVVNDEGLVRVKAEIKNSNSEIIEGMNVRVVVEKTIKNLTMVPKEALVFRSDKKIIFTTNNGLAQWNDVKITYENTSHYAIEKGIKPGDTIIISGNLNLTQNSTIKEQFINSEF